MRLEPLNINTAMEMHEKAFLTLLNLAPILLSFNHANQISVVFTYNEPRLMQP